MNATAGTSAWAAYDIWLGPDNCSPAASKCTGYEVMIQHDFAGNGDCTTLASASFGGSGGVPAQDWHLCKYGSELIWKLGAGEQNKVSERSGSVDILSMLTWLVNHRYLPGAHRPVADRIRLGDLLHRRPAENFTVSNYSITPTPSSSAAPARHRL